MTITKTATMAQTKASNQDWRTESAPENIGGKKLPATALFAACINMMINAHPPKDVEQPLRQFMTGGSLPAGFAVMVNGGPNY
jgi:hypothetical protein